MPAGGGGGWGSVSVPAAVTSTTDGWLKPQTLTAPSLEAGARDPGVGRVVLPEASIFGV